jgi:hypothetical protein
VEESDWFLTCLYSKLSSVNKRNVEVETTSGRSLMYTRNNSGPNTVLCGPLESTSSFADSHPSGMLHPTIVLFHLHL